MMRNDLTKEKRKMDRTQRQEAYLRAIALAMRGINS